LDHACAGTVAAADLPETQARLLAEVFYGPPASGRELARRLGVTQPTVARELSRLEAAGLVVLEQVGTAKIVHPATDLAYGEALRELVAYAAGVPHIVRAEYEGVEDIDEVFIHGSWAKRFHGAEGPFPNDLDLVVVSPTHTRFTLAEHRAAIEAATGMNVDQLVLPPDHQRLPELRDGAVTVIGADST
jgi:DNA-binding transcriptional ArsR family regulator